MVVTQLKKTGDLVRKVAILHLVKVEALDLLEELLLGHVQRIQRSPMVTQRLYVHFQRGFEFGLRIIYLPQLALQELKPFLDLLSDRFCVSQSCLRLFERIREAPPSLCIHACVEAGEVV